MQIEQHAEDLVEEVLQSVGEILQRERKRQNLSLHEVADKIHITRNYVEAIESNSFEKLPAMIFAKGYVKSYGELLKLDLNELMELYETYISRQLKNEKEKTFALARKRRDLSLIHISEPTTPERI